MYKNEHALKKHEDRFLARQGRLSRKYRTVLIFIEDSRMYPCEQCGSKFHSEERLKYHVKELIEILCTVVGPNNEPLNNELCYLPHFPKIWK